MQTFELEETSLPALAAGLRKNLPSVRCERATVQLRSGRLMLSMPEPVPCEFDWKQDHWVWRSPEAQFRVSLRGFRAELQHSHGCVRLFIRMAGKHPGECGPGETPGEEEDAIRAVFAERSNRAVAHLQRQLPKAVLRSAIAAQADVDVVLRALQSPEAIAESSPHCDPWHQARLRGIQASRELLASAGGGLSSAEVATILGITRQAVDKRRKAGQLLALKLGRRGYVYPARQFTETGVLPGWPEVLAVLRDHSPWAQLIFLMSPNSYLGGAVPLHKLIAGDTVTVLKAASCYLEHGAA